LTGAEPSRNILREAYDEPLNDLSTMDSRLRSALISKENSRSGSRHGKLFPDCDLDLVRH